jgi:hypothetical protein
MTLVPNKVREGMKSQVPCLNKSKIQFNFAVKQKEVNSG